MLIFWIIALRGGICRRRTISENLSPFSIESYPRGCIPIVEDAGAALLSRRAIVRLEAHQLNHRSCHTDSSKRETVVMSLEEDGTCELTKNETGSGFAFAALDFTPKKLHTGHSEVESGGACEQM